MFGLLGHDGVLQRQRLIFFWKDEGGCAEKRGRRHHVNDAADAGFYSFQLCIATAALPNGNVFIVYNKFFVSYARFMVIDPSEST